MDRSSPHPHYQFGPFRIDGAKRVLLREGATVPYARTRDGISNIYSQPLDGSPSKQVTDFNSGLIFQFAWSHDGKNLICARGVETSDVVLISNFR